MTLGGWINMLLSVGFVTVLFMWCIFRVLRGSRDPNKQMAHIEPIEEDQTEER